MATQTQRTATTSTVHRHKQKNPFDAQKNPLVMDIPVSVNDKKVSLPPTDDVHRFFPGCIEGTFAIKFKWPTRCLFFKCFNKTNPQLYRIIIIPDTTLLLIYDYKPGRQKTNSEATTRTGEVDGDPKGYCFQLNKAESMEITKKVKQDHLRCLLDIRFNFVTVSVGLDTKRRISVFPQFLAAFEPCLMPPPPTPAPPSPRSPPAPPALIAPSAELPVLPSALISDLDDEHTELPTPRTSMLSNRIEKKRMSKKQSKKHSRTFRTY